MSGPNAGRGCAPDPDRFAGSAEPWIDHGLLAAAVGRRFSHGDEFLGLHWQQGQRHGADAINFQQRRQQLSCAGREEVAGPANFTQYYGEVGSDHRYEACRQNANERG